jgi:hypothetical protein
VICPFQPGNVDSHVYLHPSIQWAHISQCWWWGVGERGYFDLWNQYIERVQLCFVQLWAVKQLAEYHWKTCFSCKYWPNNSKKLYDENPSYGPEHAPDLEMCNRHQRSNRYSAIEQLQRWRRQCMLMLIWLHVNQTWLRIVFTNTLIISERVRFTCKADICPLYTWRV